MELNSLVYKIVLKITESKAIILIDDRGNCKFYNTDKLVEECNNPTKQDWMEVPDVREDAWWCK